MGPEIQMGIEMKDRVTGFVGFVTGRAEYITGCSQVLLTPRVDKDGKPGDGRWYDETRLAATGGEALDTAGMQQDTGPDAPAPVK